MSHDNVELHPGGSFAPAESAAGESCEVCGAGYRGLRPCEANLVQSCFYVPYRLVPRKTSLSYDLDLRSTRLAVGAAHRAARLSATPSDDSRRRT